jgi:phosphoribosylformylglycinamidine cyclo-ligase
MSNGHTLARTSLLSSTYIKKYPEVSHSGMGRYTGRYKLEDRPEGLGASIGEALLSPTRLFSPIALAVFKKIGSGIHGMVHNTGGGQTKCLRVGSNIQYVKDNLPEPDPIFGLIKKEARVDWQEMYQDFNMGIGFEFIVDPESAEEVQSIAERFGIGVHPIGRCEKGVGKNTLKIQSMHGGYQYY